MKCGCLRGDESSWDARPDEEGGFCGIRKMMDCRSSVIKCDEAIIGVQLSINTCNTMGEFTRYQTASAMPDYPCTSKTAYHGLYPHQAMYHANSNVSQI